MGKKEMKHLRTADSGNGSAVGPASEEGTYDIRHLREVILIVANEVKRVCDKNGIPYSLDGGSLIGAVRHRGFIPWDDDFDIDLTRENYERFLEACKTDLGDDFFLQTYETDPGYPKGFCKVLLKGTKVVEEASADSGFEKGIFIDVFPWDNVPDNVIAKYLQMFVVYACGKILHQKAGSKVPAGSGAAKRAVFSILRGLGRIVPEKTLVDLRESFLKKYPSTTKNVACMVCIAGYRKTEMPRGIFDSYTELPFEDTSFSAVADYDTMLTRIFGDYMQLPPVEKRKTHHYVEVDFGKY